MFQSNAQSVKNRFQWSFDAQSAGSIFKEENEHRSDTANHNF
jgi:hypothetical protein